MTESIIVALISGAVTLVVCLINNNAQIKKQDEISNKRHAENIALQQESTQLINYKIDELSDRVNKHNNLIERTYNLEKKVELQEEKMRVANHRISDLEQHEKEIDTRPC